MNCVPQLYPPVLFDSIELHKTANKADRASVVEEQFILDICTVTFDRLLISTVMVVSKCETLDGSRVRAVYSKAKKQILLEQIFQSSHQLQPHLRSTLFELT